MTYKVGDVIGHRNLGGPSYLVIGSDRFNYFLEVIKGSGFRWWQVWRWPNAILGRREKTGQFRALYKGTAHRNYRCKGLKGKFRQAAPQPSFVRFAPTVGQRA